MFFFTGRCSGPTIYPDPESFVVHRKIVQLAGPARFTLLIAKQYAILSTGRIRLGNIRPPLENEATILQFGVLQMHGRAWLIGAKAEQRNRVSVVAIPGD